MILTKESEKGLTFTAGNLVNFLDRPDTKETLTKFAFKEIIYLISLKQSLKGTIASLRLSLILLLLVTPDRIALDLLGFTYISIKVLIYNYRIYIKINYSDSNNITKLSAIDSNNNLCRKLARSSAVFRIINISSTLVLAILLRFNK